MDKLLNVLRKIPKFKDLSDEELKKKATAIPLFIVLGVVGIGYTLYNLNKSNEEQADENVSIEVPKPLATKPKTLSEMAGSSNQLASNQNQQNQIEAHPKLEDNKAQPQQEQVQMPQTSQTQNRLQAQAGLKQDKETLQKGPQPQTQSTQQQTQNTNTSAIKVDLVKGLPSDIVRLDYEIEKLEKQKKLVELKKQIEELEGKKPLGNRGAVPELPDVAILKQELQRMKLEQEKMFQEKVKKDINPADESGQMNFIIKSIYCVNKNECNGVVADKTGEYLVRAGSRLPSGLVVESINPDGIYFSSSFGRFFRPVDMSLEPQQKETRQKTSGAGAGVISGAGIQSIAKPIQNIQRPVEGR